MTDSENTKSFGLLRPVTAGSEGAAKDSQISPVQSQPVGDDTGSVSAISQTRQAATPEHAGGGRGASPIIRLASGGQQLPSAPVEKAATSANVKLATPRRAQPKPMGLKEVPPRPVVLKEVLPKPEVPREMLPKPSAFKEAPPKPRVHKKVAMKTVASKEMAPKPIVSKEVSPTALAETPPKTADLQEAPHKRAALQQTPIIEFFPALPLRRRRRSYAGLISFLICVVLPIICASIYYIAYATNQYVSEFRFAIRDSKNTGTASPAATLPNIGGMGLAATPNPQENFIVVDFLKSRQAVEELEAAIGIRRLYSRPEVDWWARFDASLPMEEFVKYWQRMVSSSYDQVTGIAAAEVRAFTPEDAYLIATTLVRLSEELINKIANRPQRDAVRFAEEDVKRAETRLTSVRSELTRFRNSEQLIDPQTNVVNSNVILAQSLRATLSQLQTEYSSLEKERSLSRNAPAIVSLEGRIAATRQQLAAIEGQIANVRDGASPLSKVVAEFERLDLERQFSQNMVLSTLQKLDEARASLLAQHVYVTAYISPALPQSSTYPNRIVSIVVTGLACFLFWIVSLLIVRSVREHLN